MKYFILLLLSFNCMLAQAQSSLQWSFTLSGGLSGQNSHSYETNYTALFGRSTYLSEKKYQPTFGGEIWVGVNWKRHFEATLGLAYLQTNMFSKSERNQYDMFDAMISFLETKLYSTEHYIQVPFKINYVFGKTDKWFRPYLGVGISASYLLKTSFSFEEFGGSINAENHFFRYHNKFDLTEERFEGARWHFPISVSIGAHLGHLHLSISYTDMQTKHNDVFYFLQDGFSRVPKLLDRPKGYTTLNFQYAF